MDKQEGRRDLRDGTDDRPDGKGTIGHGERPVERQVQDRQIGQRKGHAVAEAHEGGARRAHSALEVLLQDGAQILEECAGEGDEDPGGHGSGVNTPGRGAKATALAENACPLRIEAERGVPDPGRAQQIPAAQRGRPRGWTPAHRARVS